MNARHHRLGMILCVCAAGAMLTSDRSEAQQGPELKAKFQQDLRRADVDESNLRPRGDAVRWDNEGVRITLTAGKKEAVNPGVVAKFKIRGDFEITGAYDLVQVDWPTEGYGVGVSLYAAIEPDAGDAVSISRRTMTTGKKMFLSNVMKRSTKEKDRMKFVPSTSTTARIRLKRIGSKVQFWAAEGDNADFIQIAEEEFDPGEIRYLQFGGNAGNSSAGLDLRLLELTVHAEELPGLVQPRVLHPAGPDGNPQEPASRGWLVAALLIGGVVFFVLLLTASAGFLLLRRGGGQAK